MHSETYPNKQERTIIKTIQTKGFIILYTFNILKVCSNLFDSIILIIEMENTTKPKIILTERKELFLRKEEYNNSMQPIIVFNILYFLAPLLNILL